MPSKCELPWNWKRGPATLSAIAEILRVVVGITQIVVDQNRGLTSQFKSFAALVARYQIVQPDHVGSRLRKLSLVFLADSARQFSFLPADLPAHGSFEFTAAARANEFDLAGLLFFGIERPFVHGQGAVMRTAPSIVTNSSPRSRQRGSQCARAASVRLRSPFCRRCEPS